MTNNNQRSFVSLGCFQLYLSMRRHLQITLVPLNRNFVLHFCPSYDIFQLLRRGSTVSYMLNQTHTVLLYSYYLLRMREVVCVHMQMSSPSFKRKTLSTHTGWMWSGRHSAKAFAIQRENPYRKPSSLMVPPEKKPRGVFFFFFSSTGVTQNCHPVPAFVFF